MGVGTIAVRCLGCGQMGAMLRLGGHLVGESVSRDDWATTQCPRCGGLLAEYAGVAGVAYRITWE